MATTRPESLSIAVQIRQVRAERTTPPIALVAGHVSGSAREARAEKQSVLHGNKEAYRELRELIGASKLQNAAVQRRVDENTDAGRRWVDGFGAGAMRTAESV